MDLRAVVYFEIGINEVLGEGRWVVVDNTSRSVRSWVLMMKGEYLAYHFGNKLRFELEVVWESDWTWLCADEFL
jgi:hypothetical protein